MIANNWIHNTNVVIDRLIERVNKLEKAVESLAQKVEELSEAKAKEEKLKNWQGSR